MTEAEERPGRRQRSLHCKPAEQAMIRERAAAASKTVSRYVMELALADDPDRHPLVLSDVVRRAILTPQYHATSIAYRADRRATHAPNNTRR